MPSGLSGLIIKRDYEPFSTVDGLPKDLVCGAEFSEEEVYLASNDPAPFPHTKDREYYHGDKHASWWASGLSDLRGMQAAAARVGLEFNGSRYYEMGCASGRVVRHVAAQTSADVWCSDINVRHVEWIRQHLDPKIKVFGSTALPYLPIEPNSMDIVSAFSVFTHIDDLEFMWLAELRRILRPGGMAYITISTENTWEKYKRSWIKDHLTSVAEQVVDYEINDDLFEGDLPLEKTAFLWQTQQVYNCTVFHKSDYIKRDWGRFFDVHDIVPNGHIYQDVAILTKPLR